jgi:hypothetical protein
VVEGRPQLAQRLPESRNLLATHVDEDESEVVRIRVRFPAGPLRKEVPMGVHKSSLIA